MTLSICCITYNHEEFIAQAIQSFLKQKTNFEFEIIIADDASKDKTQQICKNFELLNPSKIKLICNKLNIGMIPNFIQALNECSGKYIALCEGDDYWTDPNKLQKQVDFLEANPDYAICFHAVNILNNGVEQPSGLNLSTVETTYSLTDLAALNLIHTPSVVFRNGLFDNLPDWFYESPVGDYVIHLLNAKKGLIKYFPDIMAVYRVHSMGVWGQYNVGIHHPKWLWLLDKLLSENFEEPVLKKFAEQKTKTFLEYLEWLFREKKYDLINDAYAKFYGNKEKQDVKFLINAFVNQLKQSDKEVAAIKNRRSYKIGSKLAGIRYKYSRLLQKNNRH